MIIETIIKAAEETAKYYLIVNNDERICAAFKSFANALRNEQHNELLKAEQDHNDALEDSMGSHGQG